MTHPASYMAWKMAHIKNVSAANLVQNQQESTANYVLKDTADLSKG